MGNTFCPRRAAHSAKPTGLYPKCEWDEKLVLKYVKKKQLAPRLTGVDEGGAGLEECPICLLNYKLVNRSKCCSKPICTECFLQYKRPSEQLLSPCPFCKSKGYTVVFRTRTKEEIEEEDAEERRVTVLRQQIRLDELQRERKRPLADGSAPNRAEAGGMYTPRAVQLLLDVSGATGPEPSSAHQSSALGAPFDAVPSSSVDWRSRQRAQPLTLRTSPPASPPLGSIAALARAQQRPARSAAAWAGVGYEWSSLGDLAQAHTISEVELQQLEELLLMEAIEMSLLSVDDQTMIACWNPPAHPPSNVPQPAAGEHGVASGGAARVLPLITPAASDTPHVPSGRSNVAALQNMGVMAAEGQPVSRPLAEHDSWAREIAELLMPKFSMATATEPEEDHDPPLQTLPDPSAVRVHSATSAELAATAERLVTEAMLPDSPATHTHTQAASTSSDPVAMLDARAPQAATSDAACAAAPKSPGKKVQDRSAPSSSRGSARAPLRSTSSALPTTTPLDRKLRVPRIATKGATPRETEADRLAHPVLPDADSGAHGRVEGGMHRADVSDSPGAVTAERGAGAEPAASASAPQPETDDDLGTALDRYPGAAPANDEPRTPIACDDDGERACRARSVSNVTTSDFEFNLDLPDGSPEMARYVWNIWQKKCDSDQDDDGD